MFPLLAPNPGQITPQAGSKKCSGNASAGALPVKKKKVQAEALPVKKKKVQAEALPARSLCGSNAKILAKVCKSLAAVVEEKELVTLAEKGSPALTPALASSDRELEFEGEDAAVRLQREGTPLIGPVEEEIPPVVQPEDEAAETAALQ